MTVEAIPVVSRQAYSGPGVYEFDFYLTNASYIVVKWYDTSGTPTTLEKDVDYVVTINEDVAGGSIDVSSPSDTDGTLVLSSAIPYTQPRAWSAEGHLNLEKLELSLDEIVLLIQQVYNLTESSNVLWRDDWATELDYDLLNIVVASDGSWYLCVVAHTSDVWATDLASAYWEKVFDFGDVQDMYDAIDAWQTQVAIDKAATAADALATAADLVDTAQDVIDAAASAVEAAGYASGLNLPAIAGGDADKFLQVKDDETGFELIEGYTKAGIDALVYTQSEVDALIAAISQGIYDGYVRVADVKSQNTDGGTFSNGAWRVRAIAETDDTENLASVSSNQLTLAAGTWRCLITCPAASVLGHQAILYDTTGVGTLLVGTASDNASDGSTTNSVIAGRFTLSVESVLEIRHRCESSRADIGLGEARNWTSEVYTVGEFWREV